jgi:ATP-dependent DNA helicase DinG
VEATGKTTRRLKWTCSPINVAGHLKEHLFGEVESVVLTSATLSTAGRNVKRKAAEDDENVRPSSAFDYLRSRVGLEKGNELLLGSPFDYEKQCTIYLSIAPPNCSPPNSPLSVTRCLRRVAP